MTTISEKAHYVRTAENPGGHHCHWPGCKRAVAPAAWGCKTHWFKLPASLRRKVWLAYNPGQETTKKASERYLAVAQEVQQWIKQSAAE